jgi:hypothetical protein
MYSVALAEASSTPSALVLTPPFLNLHHDHHHQVCVLLFIHEGDTRGGQSEDEVLKAQEIYSFVNAYRVAGDDWDS